MVDLETWKTLQYMKADINAHDVDDVIRVLIKKAKIISKGGNKK